MAQIQSSRIQAELTRIRAELADAERHLREMRRNLQDAQEWVKKAEKLHADKQRELAEALERGIHERKEAVSDARDTE